MQDFWEIIKTRRSVRKFKKDPVPDAVILKIIEAGSFAPSGNNKQNWHFIVVKTPSIIKAMADAVRAKADELAKVIGSQEDKRKFLKYTEFYTVFERAPVTIACVAQPYESPATKIFRTHGIFKEYKSTGGLQGVSAAIENILLSAKALGYGSCWMTGPMIARAELGKILGIVPPDELISLVPLGLPDENQITPPRKKVDDIVTFK